MKHKIQIFNFHSISDTVSASYPSIPVKVFKRLCGFLDRNYFIAPLHDIEQNFRTKKTVGIITFDDGFADFYENALEILAEKKISATQHLITDCVDSGQTLWSQKLNDLIDAYYFNSQQVVIPELGLDVKLKNKKNAEKLCLHIFYKILYDPTLLNIVKDLEKSFKGELQFAKMMNQEQIRECLQYDVSFGSHTVSHKNLTLLSREDLEHEVAGSKLAVERITGSWACLSFAFPNGQYNERVVEACKKAGYRFLLTTVARSVTPPVNRFELPRFDIFGDKYWKNVLKITSFKHLR